MNRLFVSYHYIARQDEIVYQGFGRMVCHGGYVPKDEETLELLEEKCARYTEESFGFDTCTVSIISWQLMKGV